MVLHLHFHSKQSARTLKKPVRLSCQVSLKKPTLKHISVMKRPCEKDN